MPPGHPADDDVRRQALSPRRAWLDALRGVAVVIMVGAHVTDAWTRDADRHDDRFFATVFVNGLAAPLFMLLAGVALTMAAGSRTRRGGRAEGAAAAWRRGWQVFGLAFLFRLQSQALGWGAWVNLLKVDILNVMGVSMVAAAAIWRVVPSRLVRVVAYAIVTAGCAFLTPMMPAQDWLAPLPDPIEWYLRPAPRRTWFTLFPWMGFLTAGALIGELIDAARTTAGERRLHGGLAVAAVAGVAGGWAASYLPSLYADADFWSTSPAFFLIRLGLVVAGLPLAWALSASWAPLVALGRSSLFVYWVHVELVYGVTGLPLKRLLPWEAAIVATGLVVVLMHRLVRAKDAWMARRALPPRLALLAPILK